MKKHAELLAENMRVIIEKAAVKSISHILEVVDQCKCDVEKWPLSFGVGGEIIPNNQRVLNDITERLTDGYGFVVLINDSDCLVIDLPVEIIASDTGPITTQKCDSFITALDAGKIAAEGREESLSLLFEQINKKIKDTAKKGKTFVDIDVVKDKLINKDIKIIKKVYSRMTGLGFCLDDSIKKDAAGKIMFDKIETLRIRWQ